MALFNFSKQERESIIQKIQDYCSKELDQELGQFDASFLLNFFAEEIGPHFYNKAIQDSQLVLRKRIDEIRSAIDDLEKPIAAKR